MDQGVKMLSDAWISIFAYYEMVWSEGWASVLKELDNNPIDPDTCIYQSAKFPKCRIITLPDGEPAVRHARPEDGVTSRCANDPQRRAWQPPTAWSERLRRHRAIGRDAQTAARRWVDPESAIWGQISAG
jgi:hypothetical protein